MLGQQRLRYMYRCLSNINNNNHVPAGQLGYGDSENRGHDARDMGDALLYIDLGLGFVIDTMSLGGQFSCVLSTNHSVKLGP